MKGFSALCMMAASAAAWTVDLRNNYEGAHTIYIKSGESIDVLLDGNVGTGYKWINSVDYANNTDNDHFNTNNIHFQGESKVEDDPVGMLGGAQDMRMASMGHATTWKHTFNTEDGLDFAEDIKFVYERPWMLHSFPETRSEATINFSSVNVIAKSQFAYDLASDNFNLDNMPNNIQVRQGDLIRLVIRENPTTGYWWHTNAKRTQNAAIREVYNGFEAPNLGLIGASGLRIFVFQINDVNAELRMGLSRPGDMEDLEWDNADDQDELEDHLFAKRISFSASGGAGFKQGDFIQQ